MVELFYVLTEILEDARVCVRELLSKDINIRWDKKVLASHING